MKIQKALSFLKVRLCLESEMDHDLTLAIAERAHKKSMEYSIDYPLEFAALDVAACHLNGCPLQLGELLKARDADFVHDMLGIRSHLDRKTSKLMDCFVPRYAVQGGGR